MRKFIQLAVLVEGSISSDYGYNSESDYQNISGCTTSTLLGLSNDGIIFEECVDKQGVSTWERYDCAPIPQDECTSKEAYTDSICGVDAFRLCSVCHRTVNMFRTYANNTIVCAECLCAKS